MSLWKLISHQVFLCNNFFFHDLFKTMLYINTVCISRNLIRNNRDLMLTKIFVALRLNADKNWKKKVEESSVILSFTSESHVSAVPYIQLMTQVTFVSFLQCGSFLVILVAVCLLSQEVEGWRRARKFFRNVGTFFRRGFGNINRFVSRFKSTLNSSRGPSSKGSSNGDTNSRDGDSASSENVCNILKFIHKYTRNKPWFLW